MTSVDGGDEMELASHPGHNSGGGDEEALFVLTFLDHQPVQADVVDVDSVRQIAPRVLFPEGHFTRKPIALDRDERSDRLAGTNRKLEDTVFGDQTGIAVGFQRDTDLFISESLDRGERTDFAIDFFLPVAAARGDGE